MNRPRRILGSMGVHYNKKTFKPIEAGSVDDWEIALNVINIKIVSFISCRCQHQILYLLCKIDIVVNICKRKYIMVSRKQHKILNNVFRYISKWI
jgi:hypothetical protein